MKKNILDIDAQDFYKNPLDPFLTFNRNEITLSHLFRAKMPILGNRTYAECLYHYLNIHGYIRPQIIEVGCGLGDIALGMLSIAEKESASDLKYILYDISPTLLDYAMERLIGIKAAGYVLDSCLKLGNRFPSFNGMILSNAMIADLRSVYIGNCYSLADYDIHDEDMDEFVEEWCRITPNGYLHVGTFLFLRQISESLEPGGTAVITEYAATKYNQPSFFRNHYECGIDFDQLVLYANRLDFDVSLVDIENILGFSKDQEFLTVDIFTSQDRLARKIPQVARLWTARNALPVLAYTRDSFQKMLESDHMGLKSEASELLKALAGCFHSIHSRKFDHKNPTTWGYKCLLLKKGAIPEWSDISESHGIRIIMNVLNISELTARSHWHESIKHARMGLAQDFVDQSFVPTLITRIFWEVIKKYGTQCWKKFVIPHAKKRLDTINIPNALKERIIIALKNEIHHC